MYEDDIVLTSENIDKYYNGEKKFIVPDKILKIDSALFKDCQYLEEIELHDDLENIGSFAFEDCLSLKSIIIPPKIIIIR